MTRATVLDTGLSGFSGLPDVEMLPGAVRLGLEFERRGIAPPPHIAAITGEYRRRGLLEPQPEDDDSTPLDAAGQDQRFRERFSRLQQGFEPPSSQDRDAYISQRTNQWLDQIERDYMASPAFRRQRDTDRLGRSLYPDRLTYQQRTDLYRSISPQVWDQQREQFAREFDTVHSPMGRFVRQRQEAANQIAQEYRAQRPGATDQEVLGHVQARLAREGFTPSFAGELPATIDEPALLDRLEQIRLQNAPLADRLPTPLSVAAAPLAGGIKSFQDTFASLVGTAGIGGLAEAAERIIGHDLGLRDVQHGVEQYWGRTAQQNRLLASSQEPGIAGKVKRFSDMMGRAGGDLAQFMVASHVGLSGAAAAGFSARLANLFTTLTAMGFTGVKEGGGAYRDIYDSLIAQGYNHAEANRRALYSGISVGLVNALLEKGPIEQFVFASPEAANRLQGALRGLVVEGGTEAAQELVSVLGEFEAGASGGPVVSWGNVERIATAALAGGVVGGGIGGLTGGGGTASGLQRQIEQQDTAELMAMIERARQMQAQRVQARTGQTPPVIPPPETPQPPPTAASKPRLPARYPKIIATPRQVARWYARTYQDQANAGAIEALAATSPGRYRLVDVPVQMIQPNITGGPAETDPQKIEAIAKLSDEEIAALPPAITVANPIEGDKPLLAADGNHRLLALIQRGNPTIRAYVPESLVGQIQAAAQAAVAGAEQTPPISTREPPVQRPGQQEPGGGVNPARPENVIPPPPEVSTPPETQPKTGPKTRLETRLKTRPSQQVFAGLTQPTPEQIGAAGAAQAMRLIGLGAQAVDAGDIEASRSIAARLRQRARRFTRKGHLSIAAYLDQAAGRLDQWIDRTTLQQQGATHAQGQINPPGEVSTIQVQPPKEAPKVQTQEGTAQRPREDQEKQVVPPPEAPESHPPQELPREERLLRRAERAEEAMEKEYDLARTDELTGLGNLRRANEAMADMIERADQERRPMVIGTVDLVLFKQVNDVLGHEAGNRALVAAAGAMRDSIRSGEDGRPADVFGIVSRTGGDEFEFALYDVTPQQAAAVGERMQGAYAEAMRKEGIVLPGGLKTVMGFGFVFREPNDARSIDTLRKEADQDLEKRKTELKRREGLPMTRSEAEAIIQRARAEQEATRAIPETGTDAEIYERLPPPYREKAGPPVPGEPPSIRWARRRIVEFMEQGLLGPEGIAPRYKKEYDRVLDILNSWRSYRPAPTGIEGVNLWLFSDEEGKTPRAEEIIKNLQKATKTESESPREPPNVAGKPRPKPPKAKTNRQIMEAMAKGAGNPKNYKQNPEHWSLNIYIDDSGRRLTVPNERFAWRLISDQPISEDQEIQLYANTLEPSTNTPYQKRKAIQDTIDSSVKSATRKKPDATFTDILDTLRRLYQVRIATGESMPSARMGVNRDGTLGFATADPAFGMAEVGISPGFREMFSIDIEQLIDTLRMMYSLDVAGVELYGSQAVRNSSKPFVLVGHSSDGKKRVEAVIMPDESRTLDEYRAAYREYVGGKPSEPAALPAPPIREKNQKEGEGQIAGSPMSGPIAPAPEKPQEKAKEPVPKNAAPPTAGGYLNDYNPLRSPEGRFRRTWSDTSAKLRSAIAAARARRDGKAESPAIDNIYRIISDTARRFNLGPPGLGRARILKKWANGFYRIKPESVRLRRGSYVSTFVHELGHHLHKVLFPRGTRKIRGQVVPASSKGLLSAHDFPPAWLPELVRLGKDLYGDRHPPVGGYATEGWAETVRFLLTNPAHLKSRAPTVYQGVAQTLVAERPDVWLALLDARVRLLNAMRLGSVDPVDQYIAHDPPGVLARFNLINLWDDLRIRLFDRYQRLITFKKDLSLEGLPAHLDPHTAALRANGHISGDVKLAMERGTFNPADPQKKPTGPGLIEILRPVSNPDNLRLWQNYMVARRTLEKRAQGYDVLPQDRHLPDQTSSEKLREFIRRTEELHPEFKAVAGRFQKFNRWLVQEYAVYHGLVSPEAALLIVEHNLEYITFRHKKTEDALSRKNNIGGAGGRGAFTGQGSGIRRFRGGLGEQLFPPLESFMVSMQGIMSRARLNQVARNIVTAYEADIPGVGRWIDRIDRPMESIRVKAEQLGQEIRKQLGIGIADDGHVVLPQYLHGLGEDQVNSLLESLIGLQGATFWKPGHRTDPSNREVTVLVDGKPRFYEIKDQRLYDLLEGLNNPYTANLFVKMLSIPGRVLRAGATQLNPSFFVPNFARDITQALTMTDTDLRDLPEQTRLRLEGMKQAFLGGNIYDLFLASGADMAGLFGEYYDSRKARLDFDAMFARPRAYGLVKGNSIRQIAGDLIRLGPIDRLNRSFEMATRLGEFAVAYERAKQRGVSEEEAIATAGQAAADITLDYQRGGTWAKQANEVIVFFNAAALGADKLGRFIARNPVRALGRIFATMIVPSLLSMLLNLDNDDYWAKPKGMRDRYWYFPMGSDDQGRPAYLKIPKPYGLGAFSIAVERSFARAVGIDPETGRSGGDPRAMDGVIQAIINEFRPTLNIAGIQPLLEVSAGDQGYSFYRDAQIVSDADKDLPLGEQGATRSSELARLLGRFLDYPPAKIDYLINGWLGGLGRDAVQVGVDPIIWAVDSQAKQGEPLKFEDWLIVRRFIAGQTRSGHEAISRFYDDLEYLRRINTGLKSRENNPNEYDAYFQRHKADLDLYREYAAAERRMGELFHDLRSVYRDRAAMSADEMDRRIDDLYTQIIETARQAHQYRQEVGKK